MGDERVARHRVRVFIAAAPLVVGLGVACGARTAPARWGPMPAVAIPHRAVRVALGAERGIARIAANRAWHLTDLSGHAVVRPTRLDGWGIERRGSRVRAVQADGYASPWVDGGILLVVDDTAGRVQWNARAYRGNLAFHPTDSATLAVNVLDAESYLRGVVPLEMGSRPASDLAAVEAQAVVARSFAFERMNSNAQRAYDLTASELDQVYGGVNAETPQGDAAVASTQGLVLSYQGRAIGAPYHAVCGGRTASASDVWRSAGAPYLQGVSDQIPGTDRSYCDLSPRFRWERSFTATALRDVFERYARQYVAAATASFGAVRDVRVTQTTGGGRVATLGVATDGGAYQLVGNDIRFVLRGPSGDLLPSTYFSLEPVIGRDGKLMQLLVHGLGNGHGVGMCQWGAIGRARAGQDVRTILHAYFPAADLARGT